MSDIYENARGIISRELTSANASLKHHERILKQTHSTLSWSSFWQEVAIQAALQAAMMGAAVKIGSAVEAKNAVSAGTAAKGAWRIPGLAISLLQRLELTAAKLVIRVTVGCSITLLRKAYAKAYRGEAFFDQKLLVGLAIATFCGAAGAPGGEIQGFLLSGPGVKSFQTLIQSVGIAGAIKNWVTAKENQTLANFIRANRPAVVESSKKAAAAIGWECVNWAKEQESSIVKQAEQEIRKIDFGKQLNLAAKLNDVFSNVQIHDILKEQTVQCGKAEIRLSLWLTINRCLAEIEKDRTILENELSKVR